MVQVLIDDSGSFSWSTPGISVFCALVAPDRSADTLFSRFESWKRSVIGKSKRELKGAELTLNQLETFSYKLFPPSDRDLRLKFVGANTELLKKQSVEMFRNQSALLFGATSEYAREQNPQNKLLIQQYLELSGWVRNRSVENTLWINVIEALIHQSLHDLVALYSEPEYDSEFDNLEFVIDQSFGRRDTHVAFWRKWLRTGLLNRFYTVGSLMLPDTWAHRDHPFNRKYSIGGDLMNVSDLYQNHMNFESSSKSIGLQIADICAHIAYRYHRGDRNLKAFGNLLPKIIRRGGSTLTLIMIDDRSLMPQGANIRQYINPMTDIEHRAVEKSGTVKAQSARARAKLKLLMQNSVGKRKRI